MKPVSNQRRTGAAALVVLAALAAGGCAGKGKKMAAEYAVTFDRNTTYQTIAGFGASGAWWAQDVGGWDNVADIVDLLYDKEKGIGLNIFRYNIGAGFPSKARDAWRRAATLETAPGSYDLSRDKNALKVFALAIERGADHNVLFVNSPPARMTVSGFTSGGLTEYVSNLNPASEEEFARYLVDITALLLDNGYTAEYLSPINEPQWGWGGEGASQEGCHYEPEQILRVGRAVALELERRGLPVKLSLAESGAWNDEKYTLSLYKRLMEDDVLSRSLDHYAVHSYWSGEKEKKTAAAFFAAIPDMLPLHQTEWCQMENGRDMGMDAGIVLAKEVHADMTILSVSSWSQWLGVSAGDYKDGLVYVDIPSRKFRAAKRMWTLGNYSRFLAPGDVRIEAASGNKNLLVSAYVTPGSSRTVVVAINETEEAQLIGLDDAVFRGATGVYVTDAEHDCRDLFETLRDGVDGYSLPPRSVVTFVGGD